MCFVNDTIPPRRKSIDVCSFCFNIFHRKTCSYIKAVGVHLYTSTIWGVNAKRVFITLLNTRHLEQYHYHPSMNSLTFPWNCGTFKPSLWKASTVVHIQEYLHSSSHDQPNSFSLNGWISLKVCNNDKDKSNYHSTSWTGNNWEESCNLRKTNLSKQSRNLPLMAQYSWISVMCKSLLLWVIKKC